MALLLMLPLRRVWGLRRAVLEMRPWRGRSVWGVLRLLLVLRQWRRCEVFEIGEVWIKEIRDMLTNEYVVYMHGVGCTLS